MFRACDANVLESQITIDCKDLKKSCVTDDKYAISILKNDSKLADTLFYYVVRYSSIPTVRYLIQQACDNHGWFGYHYGKYHYGWAAYASGERGHKQLIRYFIKHSHPHFNAASQAREGAEEQGRDDIVSWIERNFCG